MKPVILVTGGAGYIGSHTCKALARAGCQPVVVDNLSRGFRHAVKWGPLEVLDLRDGVGLRALFGRYPIAAVVHFAAFAYVGESVRDPRLYFDNNVVATLSLLDAMLASNVRTIVFSSTCATYGDPVTLPIPETHPQAPINPYGDSKLFIEKVLRWYGSAEAMRWMALRYFNAAGADADGEIGEEHDPETHLVPLAIQAALGQRPGLEIFGTDYPTPDGTAIRDYVHVTDLADAHVRALRYLEAGGDSGAANLGTGRGYSVREVVQTVERVSGRPVPTAEVARRPGDPPALYAKADRARTLLGWQPQHSDIEAIVATAHAWHARPTTVPLTAAGA
jgi:UDP-glucose-4-epimerase GalE